MALQQRSLNLNWRLWQNLKCPNCSTRSEGHRTINMHWGWHKAILTNSNQSLPVRFIIAQNSPKRNAASEKREEGYRKSPIDQFSTLFIDEESVVHDSLAKLRIWSAGHIVSRTKWPLVWPYHELYSDKGHHFSFLEVLKLEKTKDPKYDVNTEHRGAKWGWELANEAVICSEKFPVLSKQCIREQKQMKREYFIHYIFAHVKNNKNKQNITNTERKTILTKNSSSCRFFVELVYILAVIDTLWRRWSFLWYGLAVWDLPKAKQGKTHNIHTVWFIDVPKRTNACQLLLTLSRLRWFTEFHV